MTWIGNHKHWIPKQSKKTPRPPLEEKSKSELKTIYSVDYVVIKCPVCKSKKCPAYASDPPIRYHRCEKGHNFKSIEK